MSRKHQALVAVSSASGQRVIDPVLASQGHSSHSASTQEEAFDLLASHPFCYLIVDLKLRAGPGQPARVETGVNFLLLMRQVYPPEVLPVVVLIAKSASKDLRRRLRLAKCTSFVTKPVAGRLDALDRHLRAAAAVCARRRARCPTAPGRTPGDARVYRAGHTFHFVGECRARRHLLLVDDQEVYLPRWQFEGLFKLAASLLRDPSRFVQRRAELGPAASKLLSEMLQELRTQVGIDDSFLDRDNWGGVRFSVPPGCVTHDAQVLAEEFPHLLDLLEAEGESA